MRLAQNEIAMQEQNPVNKNEKLMRVWSDYKERHVAVRVEYSQSEEQGCTIYTLHSIERFD
ncbi:MAG TPA: hypothetical protein DEH78_09610 [Solibacterales bacterium]|nr:hypothetical protein [Bryobacterales bacterium]